MQKAKRVSMSNAVSRVSRKMSMAMTVVENMGAQLQENRITAALNANDDEALAAILAGNTNGDPDFSIPAQHYHGISSGNGQGQRHHSIDAGKNAAKGKTRKIPWHKRIRCRHENIVIYNHLRDILKQQRRRHILDLGNQQRQYIDRNPSRCGHSEAVFEEPEWVRLPRGDHALGGRRGAP